MKWFLDQKCWRTVLEILDHLLDLDWVQHVVQSYYISLFEKKKLVHAAVDIDPWICMLSHPLGTPFWFSHLVGWWGLYTGVGWPCDVATRCYALRGMLVVGGQDFLKSLFLSIYKGFWLVVLSYVVSWLAVY